MKATILRFDPNRPRATQTARRDQAVARSANDDVALDKLFNDIAELVRRRPLCFQTLASLVNRFLATSAQTGWAARRTEIANNVWMNVYRLHAGPKRTFWRSVRGASADYRGQRTFESVDDVITEVISNLGDLDAGAAVQILCGEHQFVELFVQRGRYRVEVFGLPAWMQREWLQRARVTTEAGA